MVRFSGGGDPRSNGRPAPSPLPPVVALRLSIHPWLRSRDWVRWVGSCGAPGRADCRRGGHGHHPSRQRHQDAWYVRAISPLGGTLVLSCRTPHARIVFMYPHPPSPRSALPVPPWDAAQDGDVEPRRSKTKKKKKSKGKAKGKSKAKDKRARLDEADRVAEDARMEVKKDRRYACQGGPVRPSAIRVCELTRTLSFFGSPVASLGRRRKREAGLLEPFRARVSIEAGAIDTSTGAPPRCGVWWEYRCGGFA